jgi:hypothetical protein
MNSVSANGYQIVISSSQATARSDVSVATIQVCGTALQSFPTEFGTLIAKCDLFSCSFDIPTKYFYVVLHKLHKLNV